MAQQNTRQKDRSTDGRQVRAEVRSGAASPREASETLGGLQGPLAGFGGAVAREQRPIDDEIRLRAYERYISRQGAPGSAEDDWNQAERHVRSSYWPDSGQIS